MKDGPVFHSAFFLQNRSFRMAFSGESREMRQKGIPQDAGKSGVCSRIRQQGREKRLQYEKSSLYCSRDRPRHGGIQGPEGEPVELLSPEHLLQKGIRQG